jgi:3-methylcrotonyl-CoA carboxylase alpha subunit
VLRGGRETIVKPMDFDAAQVALHDAGGTVTSPFHGKVLELLVDVGDIVRKGERLAVIEAMKMEHAILAPIDGVVAQVAAAVGQQVAERAKIVVIEPVAQA